MTDTHRSATLVSPRAQASSATRRGFLGLSALAVAGFAAACGSDSSSGSDGDGAAAKKTIGVVVPVVNDYVLNLLTGIASVVVPLGYEVAGYSTNFTPADEPGAFNKLVTQDVVGIVVLPTTPDSATRGVIAAERADIPVVNVGWASPTTVDDKYVGRVTLGSVDGAKLIGAWLADNATPGEICLIEGLRGNETSDQIKQGITEAVTALGGAWSIVDSSEGGYTRDGATKSMETLTTSHPDCKVFISFAAEMGSGIASWCERNERTDLVTISVDGNGEMIPLIEDGTYWSADCYYASAQSGALGAKLLTDYLADGSKSDLVTVDTVMIDKTNIDAVLKENPLNYPEYLDLAKSAIS